MVPAKRTITKSEPCHHDIRTKRTKTTEGSKEVDHPPSMKSEDVSESTHNSTALKYRSMLSPKDLPRECLRGFRVAFRPAIRDLAGTLGPWELPADADVVRIWNDCFPKRRLDASKDLHATVSKLVEDTVQSWRRAMAKTAAECVKMELKSSFKKQHQRVSHAAWLLGDDKKDRKRPFYYKNYGKGTQPSGIFQSPFVAMTLAVHLQSISRIPEESRMQEYPVGALAVSILAVKRALTWARTGTERIPKSPEGNFSRANWGDHYKREGSRYVFVRSAGNIVAVISKLREIQWERILAEARKYATQKSGPTVSKTLLEEEQSDFEVEDWDDDFE